MDEAQLGKDSVLSFSFAFKKPYHMQKLREGILGKKGDQPMRKAYSSAAKPTTENKQTAQPQILGRLKMGHRVIQLKKKLGQGGYAIVYQAMDESTYKEYVLKRMDCKVSVGTGCEL